MTPLDVHSSGCWLNPCFHLYMAMGGLELPAPGQRFETIAEHPAIKGYSVVVETHDTYALCYGSAPSGSRGGFCWRQPLEGIIERHPTPPLPVGRAAVLGAQISLF